MGIAIRPVKLLKLPTVNPRRLSKTILRLQPKAAVVEEQPDPLAGWESGFSTTAAEAAIQAMGVHLPVKPSYEAPELPDDVTMISSEELGMLHAQFVAYVGWLETQSCLLDVNSDEDDAYLEHVEAEVHLIKSGTVQDKKAKVKNDPRFIEHEQRALVSKAKARLFRTQVKRFERFAAALSREMSRRTPTSE